MLELAQNASDRKVKVAACEVLHSMIILLIGVSTTDSSHRLVPYYKKVLPALFALAVDSESVTQQLFQPLAVQVVHWFTSKRTDNDDEITSQGKDQGTGQKGHGGSDRLAGSFCKYGARSQGDDQEYEDKRK